MQKPVLENALVCTVSDPTTVRDVFRMMKPFNLPQVQYSDFYHPEIEQTHSWEIFFNKVNKHLYSFSSLLVNHSFNDLKHRKKMVKLAMEHGKMPVAIWVDAHQEHPYYAMKHPTAKPCPTEGWQRIYRYKDDTDNLTLMWDKLTGKKSDRINWEQP